MSDVLEMRNKPTAIRRIRHHIGPITTISKMRMMIAICL